MLIFSYINFKPILCSELIICKKDILKPKFSIFAIYYVKLKHRKQLKTMKYKFFYLLSLFETLCWAQNHFELNEISKNYHVSIDIATCNEKECFGRSSVSLTDKETSEKLLTFSDNFTFTIETDSLNLKKAKFDEEPHPLIFDDFNFDGFEDIALINRSLGNSIYDIYTFDSV